MIKQPPPFCIQVELTEGCNLACSFCGIAGIRDNGANGPKDIRGKNSHPYKFLSLANAKVLAEKIVEARQEHKWNPRIEMAMHGEPTMNPEYKEIVQTLREHLPTTHLQMTTNGGGLLRGDLSENIDDLMKAGLNVLLLDVFLMFFGCLCAIIPPSLYLKCCYFCIPNGTSLWYSHCR